MFLGSDDRPKPLTPEQIEQWIAVISRKRLDLHILATEPWNSPERNAAFIQMTELLQDAIEEVRVISVTLREGSQAIHERSAELLAHSTHLLEQRTKSIEHAEHQILDIFRDETRQGEQS